MFTLRPVVFIGLISYSLYLWHWPLVAFSHYWALEEIPLAQRWAIVGASLGLAILSWKFVETPFRKRRLGSSRPAMFGYAATGTALVLASGLSLLVTKGFPSRFSERVYAFDRAKSEASHNSRITHPTTLADAQTGRLPRLGAPAPASVALLVWGDSHARSIIPATVAAAEKHGSAVVTAWHSSTAPVQDWVPHPKFAGFSLGDDSPAYAGAVMSYVHQENIPAVLLAARWSGYFAADAELVEAGSPPAEPIGEALLNTVKSLNALGTRVWVLREVPNHRASVPKALVRAEILGAELSPYLCTTEDLTKQNAAFDRLIPRLEAEGARIIDASALMQTDDGRHFTMQREGIALYYDHHHLTQAGARLVAPLFEKIFSN